MEHQTEFPICLIRVRNLMASTVWTYLASGLTDYLVARPKIADMRDSARMEVGPGWQPIALNGR